MLHLCQELVNQLFPRLADEVLAAAVTSITQVLQAHVEEGEVGALATSTAQLIRKVCMSPFLSLIEPKGFRECAKWAALLPQLFALAKKGAGEADGFSAGERAQLQQLDSKCLQEAVLDEALSETLRKCNARVVRPAALQQFAAAAEGPMQQLQDAFKTMLPMAHPA